jgi:type II protein arginine methyltransferase
MLQDAVRAEAYRSALARAVQPTSLVLDIGAGSGLLAMLAAQAGALEVVACEEVPALARCATQIVAANGYAQSVVVVPKRSTALEVGKDLPRRADLIVSEVFDAGLLTEGALETLGHAVQVLLAPGGRMIPERAVVWAAPVESAALSAENRVGPVAGLDLSLFNRFATRHHVSRRLRDYPHQLLSEPQEVFRFDFRGPIAPEDATLLSFAVAQGGTCHALAFWFDLWLDDVVKVSSAPSDDTRAHWRQAIQYLDPILVEKGKTLVIRAEHDLEAIRFAPVRAPR